MAITWFDDQRPGGETWDRLVERPYASVPRVGEWVALSDQGALKHQVQDVHWENDGSVRLEFGPFPDDRDDPDSKFRGALKWAGFKQVRYDNQGKRIEEDTS